MVQIKRQIVPQSIAKQRTYNGENPITSVTIHQTGNTRPGADAQAHANIQSRLNPRQASWHYSVDDKQIIQSFEDVAQTWHAGDGKKKGGGNLTSLSIEICINSDGDYVKAVENGAKLTRHLLDKYKLTVKDVKQHYDWFPKPCPAQIRAGSAGITWAKFLDMVAADDKVKDVKPATKPTKPVAPKPAPQGHSANVRHVGTSDKGKRIESIYKGSEGLNFYAKARWSDPVGTFGYGKGWTVDNLFLVDGSPMYRVKNSNGEIYFITASTKYVKVINKAPKRKPAPKPKPSYVGKRVESIHNGELRFYKKASWSEKDQAGTLAKGYGFPTVVAKVKVDNAEQYKVKNSKGATFYITASSKYVKLV